MKNLKNHIKVLSTLSIASSDTREDTLTSIIIRTLYVNDEIAEKELQEKIKDEFDFQPYDSELFPLIEKLVEDGKLTREKGMLRLTEEEVKKLLSLETTLSDEDNARFLNFKSFLVDKLELDISIQKIKRLWAVFLEYLYDSFYEYGHDALKTLHPHIDNGSENGPYKDVLQKAILSLKSKTPDLIPIFKQAVERFPDYASDKDLEFLNDLAQKTLSFTSLGLQPELAKETIDHDIVDWVLYLDTNVLYSILGLHVHPENQACIALINLIKDNTDYIKIQVRYSELTEKELRAKKGDFDLFDDKMSDSSIKAMLKTDDLDGFSRKFYSDLLENRDATIHPSKVIELSKRTLITDKIDIGRNQKRLESIGEDYIQSRMDDYIQFIQKKNEVRLEFSEVNKVPYNEIYRSDRQIRHDVSLREIILSSRGGVIKPGEELSLNSVRFFGVTLDGVLISYDSSKIKNYQDENSFPVFFKPSYLLNRLTKVLPMKTGDYKKAFIKAITTRGFHRNTRKSEDILKIVNYLKSKGINDEKVVYNIISEDIFLSRFREQSEKEGFDQGEFIESELNREFKQKQEELEVTMNKLKESENKADEITQKNQNLGIRKSILEEELKQYKSALQKVSKEVKQLKQDQQKKTANQTSINYEAADERDKNKKLKSFLVRNTENEIAEFKSKELKKWQRKLWWNLFWVIPLITLGAILVIPSDLINFENESGNDNEGLKVVLGVIAFLLNFIFFNLIRIRYFSEREKSAKLDTLKIPRDLQAKLDELKDIE